MQIDTVDRKYFVLKIFRAQKFRMDHILYVTLRVTVGTQHIMDTHRTLEKE